MKSKYFLALIIIGSILLIGFVYPQGINTSIGWINSKSPKDIPLIPESKQIDFTLGLDLLGGAHILYKADLTQTPEEERADAMSGIRDVIERRVNLFGVSEPVIQVVGDDRLIVELAGVKDIKSAIELIGQTPFIEFRELSGEQFVSTGLNGRHIQKAQLIFDSQIGTPQVSLILNDEGKQLFADVTKRNIGSPLAIYVDGILTDAPVVQSEITNGQAVITGYDPKAAKELTQRINAGALPVPISIISQQTVGASLGQESINQSLKAGIWGLILVGLFMIIFYRLPGLVSVLALLIYVDIILAIYKIVPVTLTLPGIAGFILSMGIAVDANVLIFARIKEELAGGKTLSQSVKEGFSRAWLSIRDSHVTTLISSLVLYIFTTSIIKGFALTLGIGVLISLFTAITVTKVLLELFTGPFFQKRPWLFR